MDTCRECRGRVVHLVLDTGEQTPALDQVQSTKTNIEALAYAATFKIHVCDPAQLQRNAERRQPNKQRTAALWRYALARDCSRCGVKAGAHCENLVQRNKGITQRVVSPHDQRITDEERALVDEEFPYS